MKRNAIWISGSFLGMCVGIFAAYFKRSALAQSELRPPLQTGRDVVGYMLHTFNDVVLQLSAIHLPKAYKETFFAESLLYYSLMS